MTSPQWINPKLFLNVLKEIEPTFKRVSEFNCAPALKPGENYANLVLRIDILIELEGKQTKEIAFMLKQPLENSLIDDYSDGHDMFAIEKQMFFEVVPELEEMYRNIGSDVTFMPRCYDLKVNQKHILMENLRPRGFKNADRIAGLDTEHIECALRKLAQWHAATAVRVEKKGKYSEKMSASCLVDLFIPFINNMNVSYMEFLKENKKFTELYEKTQKYSAHIIECLKEECILNNEEFNVLCHGDFWTNNILFQYDEQGKLLGCLFVDYQIPRYGSPAQDLLHLLTACAKIEVKVAKFDYFIKFYHDNLIKNLKLLQFPKPLPKLRDIHITLLKNTFTAFISVSSWSAAGMFQSSENSNMDNLIGDSDSAKEFRRKMFNNPLFEKHLEIAGPWLLNRGYLD